VACGPGIERIAEEADAFPRCAGDRAVLGYGRGHVKRLRLELEAIAKGEADIVIGTQLVAKGHNFPLMTLVGVVDADLGLANGDPRAAERTYQLLSQVTGRAGRYRPQSHGLIQTFQPAPCGSAGVRQRAMRKRFTSAQPAERRNAGACRPLAGWRRSSCRQPPGLTPRPMAGPCAQRRRPQATSCVLGPAEAPLAMVRGRHRFRLLVHGGTRPTCRVCAADAGARPQDARLGAGTGGYRSAELSVIAADGAGGSPSTVCRPDRIAYRFPELQATCRWFLCYSDTQSENPVECKVSHDRITRRRTQAFSARF
jgi:primosomal protein N'